MIHAHLNAFCIDIDSPLHTYYTQLNTMKLQEQKLALKVLSPVIERLEQIKQVCVDVPPLPLL